MIYRKSSNTDGIILIDIMIALTLAALFATLISATSESAHDEFLRAHAHVELMDAYESGGLHSTTTLYGNERVQTITASSTSTDVPIIFDAVSARSLASPLDVAGTSLCSVDFMKGARSVSIVAVDLPIDWRIPLTHLEVRNDIAYVSADSSAVASQHFFVFDIRDPARPQLLASSYPANGLVSFAVAGNRVFAAANSTAGQLQPARLVSPSSISIEPKYRLSLPYATATSPVASALFYSKGYIYLGTEKWDGDELNIIDAHVPTALAKVVGLEIGSKVNDVYVQDGIAYVASADMNELRLVDVRNPSQPVSIGSFIPSGWQRQEGKAVQVFEDTLSLGRTSGGYNVVEDPEIISWLSTSSALLNTYRATDVPGGVYGVVVDRSHMFLATRQPGKEFMIMDRTASTSSIYALPTQPQSMTCDNDAIYILSHTAPALYEITFP